jgi:hypothetical protein
MLDVLTIGDSSTQSLPLAGTATPRPISLVQNCKNHESLPQAFIGLHFHDVIYIFKHKEALEILDKFFPLSCQSTAWQY